MSEKLYDFIELDDFPDQLEAIVRHDDGTKERALYVRALRSDSPASTGGERDEPLSEGVKELYRDLKSCEIREEGRREVMEGAVPVKVRYGRQGGFDIVPNDLPKRWVRDNTDEWIPAWLTPRNRDGGDDG